MAYDKHSHKYFGATLQIITILPQNAFYMLLSIFILLTNFLAHFVFLAPFINMRLLNTFLQTTSLNQTILSILFVDSFLLARSIKIIATNYWNVRNQVVAIFLRHLYYQYHNTSNNYFNNLSDFYRTLYFVVPSTIIILNTTSDITSVFKRILNSMDNNPANTIFSSNNIRLVFLPYISFSTSSSGLF